MLAEKNIPIGIAVNYPNWYIKFCGPALLAIARPVANPWLEESAMATLPSLRPFVPAKSEPVGKCPECDGAGRIPIIVNDRPTVDALLQTLTEVGRQEMEASRERLALMRRLADLAERLLNGHPPT